MKTKTTNKSICTRIVVECSGRTDPLAMNDDKKLEKAFNNKALE